MELASVERLELTSSDMSERWPETDLFKEALQGMLLLSRKKEIFAFKKSARNIFYWGPLVK
jgi:hypothetical protein